VLIEDLALVERTRPVAAVLQMLAAENWDGQVVAEVNTRKAKTEFERLIALRETLEFAREHLGQQRTSMDHLKGYRRRAINNLLPHHENAPTSSEPKNASTDPVSGTSTDSNGVLDPEPTE
jgi:hypothetical protein